MILLKKLENYVDGQVLVFEDGEVLRTIHKGFNRIGREWEFFNIAHEGSLAKHIVKPTHLYNDKYKCQLFDDREKYEFWFECMTRRFLRDALKELGEMEIAKEVAKTIKG